jgi:hypothetical protein
MWRKYMPAHLQDSHARFCKALVTPPSYRAAEEVQAHIEAKPVDALQLKRITVHANDLGPQQPHGLLSRLCPAVTSACWAGEGGTAHIDQDALAAVLKD